MLKKIVILCLFLFLLVSAVAPAEADPGTGIITDRELIGRLKRLEEGQKYILALVIMVIASILILIGYILWDRRTAISPPYLQKPRKLGNKDKLLLKFLDRATDRHIN